MIEQAPASRGSARDTANHVQPSQIIEHILTLEMSVLPNARRFPRHGCGDAATGKAADQAAVDAMRRDRSRCAARMDIRDSLVKMAKGLCW